MKNGVLDPHFGQTAPNSHLGVGRNKRTILVGFKYF